MTSLLPASLRSKLDHGVVAIMRRLLLIPAAVALLGAAKYDPMAHESARQDLNNYKAVSLVTLIANPSAFEGQRVRVSGFLTLRFEDAGLHLDRTAYEANIRKNAIYVEPPRWMDRETRVRLSDHYATVYATFSDGHLGMCNLNNVYSGCLVDLQRVTPNFTATDWRDYLTRDRNRFFLQQMPRALLLSLLIATITAAIVRLIIKRQSKV